MFTLTWFVNPLTVHDTVTTPVFLPDKGSFVGPPSPVASIGTLTITGSLLSSTRIQIWPTGCIYSIDINGNFAPATKPWCSPWHHRRNLEKYLERQPITMTFALGDKAHVTVVPVFSHNAIFIMLICTTIAAASLRAIALQYSTILKRFESAELSRLIRFNVFPAFGALFISITQYLNHPGPDWAKDHTIIHYLAISIAFALLMRILDNHPKEPLPLRLSPFFMAIWASTLYYCIRGISLQGFNAPIPIAIGFAGVTAGYFASIPLVAFCSRLRHCLRPLLIAIAIASSPALYWTLNIPFWSYASSATAEAVTAILSIAGISATSGPAEAVLTSLTLDFFVPMSTPAVSVQIGSYCDGLEGVFMLVFLISVILLLHWPLFSRVRHISLAYVAAIPFVLAINVVRIAGIFLYAEWIIKVQGKQKAAAVVDMFHSHIGWMLYLPAFIMFIIVFCRTAFRNTRSQ